MGHNACQDHSATLVCSVNAHLSIHNKKYINTKIIILKISKWKKEGSAAFVCSVNAHFTQHILKEGRNKNI